MSLPTRARRRIRNGHRPPIQYTTVVDDDIDVGPAEQQWIQQFVEQIDPTPSPYVTDPHGWGVNKLGEFYTNDQQVVMQSVVVNRYTAVKSAHDLGKSFIAARIAAWWLDTHPLGSAFVVTTAPTAAQVGLILWRELKQTHRKGKLAGYITGDNKWKIRFGKPSKHGVGDAHEESASDEIAVGRKPADYDPAAFQGIHARYVLVIIDEACGVPKLIYDAIDSIATNKNARVLAIGNPDDPASHFAVVCKPGSGWHVIRLDALKSAGFTAERIAPYPLLVEYMRKQKIAPSTEVIPDELYEMLVDPLWVDERIKRWGVTSPLFTSKVRGEFPLISNDTLIHPHWANLARIRETTPYATMSRIGVDVARYGKDKTIIMLRQAGHCRVAVEIPYGPVTQTAGEVIRVGTELGVVLPVACVDDVGVGGGVSDILEEENYPFVPIIGSERSLQVLPNGKPRFFNKRAELYWNLREALAGPSGTGEDGWLDIDPDDEDLYAQLTNIKYKVNRHGQIQVESKDEMEARGISSPDRADALCYCVAPDQPKIQQHHRPDLMINRGIMEEKW